MNKEDCVFCKIVKGEIPTEKVLEDKNFLAFPDAHPRVKGHSLVIPKEHFSNLMDLPENLSKEYVDAIKKTAKILTKKDDSDGFNLALNNGRAAGQIIDHVHFHILPRKINDNKKLDLSDK